MEDVADVVETVCTSWINGQKKQAVRQLLEAEDYEDVVDCIASSEFLSSEEKVKFFAYVLKSSD